MNKISIAIADDHTIFREGLRFIIEENPDMEVLYEVSNGKELLQALEKRKHPDIVILDLKMPEMGGLEAAKSMKEKYPDVMIMVLTMVDDNDHILQLIKLGVKGYLLKDDSANELCEALRKLMQNKYYFCDHVSAVMRGEINRKKSDDDLLKDKEAKLTNREREVLDLLLTAKTAEEIADKLCVSKRTVENHKRSIIEKFEVRNTVELVIKVIKDSINK